VVFWEAAIVFEEQLDVAGANVGECDSRGGVLVLLFADGDRGDACAAIARGVNGESAPAGTDFEDTVSGSDAQLRADSIELALLRGFERIAGVLKLRARVEHAGVQHKFVELVAKIVMGADIFAAALNGVGAETMAKTGEEGAGGGEKIVAIVKQAEIADAEADQSDEVGAGPVAVHVGFADADVCARKCADEKTPIVDDGHSAERGGAIAERVGFLRADDFEKAAAQVSERTKEQALGLGCKPVVHPSEFPFEGTAWGCAGA
jgi:hypothetical protein